MLFAVTTIRLNAQTNAFENTEVNTVMLRGDLEKELIVNACDDSQLDRCLNMRMGDSIVCEGNTSTKRKFTYVHRVS